MRVLRRSTFHVGLDGSPEVSIPHWQVTVEDGLGIRHDLTFDHAPADDEIVALVQDEPPQRLAPTIASKRLLKALLDEQLEDARAWEWFAAKVGADPAVPALAKAAVQAQADTEYTEAKRLALAWRQA